MAKPIAELLVSVLTFSGATVLCIDTLRTRRNIKEKLGAEKLVEDFRGMLSDDEGRRLDSQRAVEEWLGDRSLKLGWIGFALMAGGFLLDMITKLI